MNISERGKDLIKSYEGCRLEAYYCPSGILTIGYGHTGDVYPGQVITQTEADALFDQDISWSVFNCKTKYAFNITNINIQRKDFGKYVKRINTRIRSNLNKC